MFVNIKLVLNTNRLLLLHYFKSKFIIYIVMFFYLVPPRWILEPTDKAFAQGGDAKIECKADGFPKPQVTWKKAIGKHKIYYFMTKNYFI